MRLCIEVLGKAYAGILGANWSRGYTLPGSGIDPSDRDSSTGMARPDSSRGSPKGEPEGGARHAGHDPPVMTHGIGLGHASSVWHDSSPEQEGEPEGEPEGIA